MGFRRNRHEAGLSFALKIKNVRFCPWQLLAAKRTYRQVWYLTALGGKAEMPNDHDL